MEDRLVGIITIDDVIDVIQEENTEDIQKMNAMLPTEKVYLKTSVFETWKSRFPWLLLLMVSATFTGSIITTFEDKLATLTILTAFIPMLMDTGGNSGGQASVTVIRAMSLSEIEFRDYFRVVWKELRVGLVCGVTLAAVNFLKIWFVDRMLFHNDEITLIIDLAICLTLVVEIVFAKFIGCSLPMLQRKSGLTPRLCPRRLLPPSLMRYRSSCSSVFQPQSSRNFIK
jgi:magnesium transporter